MLQVFFDHYEPNDIRFFLLNCYCQVLSKVGVSDVQQALLHVSDYSDGMFIVYSLDAPQTEVLILRGVQHLVALEVVPFKRSQADEEAVKEGKL